MNIERKKLADRIYLLTFENQGDITSTFLRFQEHYESPEFRGKIFSFEEFQEWYVKNSPKGIASGKFTYYSDWNGFNIPAYVLEPFYNGKFDPLSEQEKSFLDMFRNENNAFYIIGIHKELKIKDQLLQHEISHGLFYTNDSYRAEAQQILSRFDVEAIKEELRQKAGYHEEVLEDEVHAYTMDHKSNLKTPIPEKLSAELRKLYEKYL